jgi:CRP-like cAMP-binding protein
MNASYVIQKHPVFSGLSSPNQIRLAEGSKVIFYKSEEIVFSQGESGTHCYALLHGKIKVLQLGQDGKEILLRILNAGDIFGEVIMFDKRSYPASAVSVYESTVLAVPRELLSSLLSDENFRSDFIIAILGKLRALSSQVYSLMAYDLEDRFFTYIISNWGNQENYIVPFSKKDFASAIGTIPETFSRLIARLREQGYISWEGKRLSLTLAKRIQYLDLLDTE